MGCASSTSIASFSSQAPGSDKGFFDCYALGVKLGRGAFGQVRIATPLASKKNLGATEDLAVKILDLRDKEAPDTLSSALQKAAYSEASLWLKVKSHTNVVCLHDVFYDDMFCYFVMEKCTCSLFAYLVSITELNERSVGNILSQMFRGIEQVHSAGLLHRDVKPDNFLVGGADGATVKLCDFGLSAALPSEGKLKGVFGTAPFMCPEMIKGNYYDGRADVWSMGVLAYALLFGTFPYKPKVPNSKAMKQAIVDGKPPSFEPVAPCTGQMRSDSAVAFVKALLERSPDQRPSATDALRMPYMRAVSDNRHMVFDELPSLRRMVYTAKKEGAFELRDLAKEVDIDPLLNNKQQENHGVSLPGQIPEKKIHGSVGGQRSKDKSGDWQITKSNISLNSKVWDNTSSFVTTASANSSLRGTTVPSDCSTPKLSSNCSSPSLSARTDSSLSVR